MPDLAAVVAAELSLARAAVERTLVLFAGGATVPFIARYRKEATGGLDEVQIGQIQERHEYHGELQARRTTILDSIAAQGKLSDDLRARILATRSKTEIEDLYLPYKPKRRTRATIARERGLEPLADLVWAQAVVLDKPREVLARPFVDADKGVPDVEAAWQGARDIVAERIAEDADVRASLRDLALAQGRFLGLRDGTQGSRTRTWPEEDGVSGRREPRSALRAIAGSKRRRPTAREISSQTAPGASPVVLFQTGAVVEPSATKLPYVARSSAPDPEETGEYWRAAGPACDAPLERRC